MRRHDLTPVRRHSGGRRIVTVLILTALCLTLTAAFAGAALAESVETTITTSNGAEIRTSAGLEAPSLDYTFVWWSFILVFGLLFLYYFLVLRISETEFKKIINSHFGPGGPGREGG